MKPSDEPEFEDEEVVEERMVDAKPAPLGKAFATPPLGPSATRCPSRVTDTNGPSHKNGNGPAVAVHAASPADKVRLARLKGYEGDPCSECGQLTLVRSGACCKCDTCGASSGCRLKKTHG